MADTYVLKNADHDGYNQAFSEIGDWGEVLKWANDGSIEDGDKVYKLTDVAQPVTSTLTLR